MGVMKYVTPKNITLVGELADEIQQSPTMMALVGKLDGADAVKAYEVIRNLSDKEQKVLATLIGRINTKIGRNG